ncbi:MAG TPA: DNA polymerase III subunit alpha, partial [Chryseosolibacter sp.]
KSLDNFLQRIEIGLEQLRILIRIGAFRFTGKDKQRLLWEGMLHVTRGKTKRAGDTLFNTEPKEYPLPRLTRHAVEDAFDEIELLGFCLCDPFNLLTTPDRGDTTARELMNKVGRQVHMFGYVVTTKEAATRTKETMHFGTFLDHEGRVFDTAHFPDAAKKYPFRGRGFYEIHGKVVEDFGVPVVEVRRMIKCPIVNKRAEQFMIESVNGER